MRGPLCRGFRCVSLLQRIPLRFSFRDDSIVGPFAKNSIICAFYNGFHRVSLLQMIPSFFPSAKVLLIFRLGDFFDKSCVGPCTEDSTARPFFRGFHYAFLLQMVPLGFHFTQDFLKGGAFTEDRIAIFFSRRLHCDTFAQENCIVMSC